MTSVNYQELCMQGDLHGWHVEGCDCDNDMSCRDNLVGQAEQFCPVFRRN